MNRRQIARQFAKLGLLSSVFASGSSFPATLPVESYLKSGLTFPILSVETLDDEHDRDHPARIKVARFRLSVAGSALTEARSSAWIGSGGTSTTDEALESAVKSFIDYLDGGKLVESTHAIQGRLVNESEQRLVTSTDGQHAVTDLEFEVYSARTSRFYHAPFRFAATPGSGQVVMTWTLAPTRFDTLRVILRRATGSTPPATVTDGTGVTLSGDLVTSKTDSGLAAGTYSYSLFMAYDETNATPTTADKYSAAATRSALVVS